MNCLLFIISSLFFGVNFDILDISKTLLLYNELLQNVQILFTLQSHCKYKLLLIKNEKDLYMAAKKKISKMQVFRFIVQLIFFIFLPGLYANAFLGIKVVYQGILAGTFYFADDFPSLISAIAIFPITILLGRFFCGWMCAFGAMGDWLFSISRKVFKIKSKINPKLDRVLKYLKFVILIGFFGLIWIFDMSFLDSSNPWSVFGILANVTHVPDFVYLFTNFAVGTTILLIIMIFSLFIERFFCRYLCPLGAIFTIVSKLGLTKVRKTKSNCGSCKLCTAKCSMGINLDKYDVVKSGECIQCYKCVSVCPKKNAVPSVFQKELGSVYGSVIAVLAITAIFYTGDFISNSFATGTSFASVNIQDTTVPGKYIDGVYEGTGNGFRGQTTVSVTVSGGYITNIDVVSYGDDSQYFNRAVDSVTTDIVYYQTSSVDAVSGATYSSNGIMAAVADALKNAVATTQTETTTSGTNTTGNTTGTTSNTTTQTTTKNTTGTTTATTTTQATTQAATTASSQYKDGTYSGSGNGFRGTVTVNVTISGGKITDIAVVSFVDDAPYFNRAFSGLKPSIISAQSTSVSGVSGATYSSKGIKAAVQSALNKALQ